MSKYNNILLMLTSLVTCLIVVELFARMFSGVLRVIDIESLYIESERYG